MPTDVLETWRKSAYAPEEFAREIAVNGFCVIENLIPPDHIARLKEDLIEANKQEAKYHKSENYQDKGMVLFCPLYGRSFIELVDHEPFMKPVEDTIGEASIIYSFTSTSLPPFEGNYATRIHNDCPFTIPEDYITRFQILVALDDFTLDNGATYVLPGGHRMPTAPSEEEFYKNAIRLTMPAGSVWFAHSKVWHAAAVNNTDVWRHGVTIVFCRAYMKQRLDIPRMMAGRVDGLSEKALQKLGFFAQVPASYDEYYASGEKRLHRQKLE